MVRLQSTEEATMPRVASPIPADLARAARRFEEWRSHRTGREIPADLWATAADLAGRYGVSRTARALRVQYYDLSKRVAAEPAVEEASARQRAPAGFVEILTAAAPGAVSEVLVEYERASGARMRIRLACAGSPVLADLSRVFLESGA
jgi:hypothetical protein